MIFTILSKRLRDVHPLKTHHLLLLDGVFKLELFLPDDYPMTPPKIRFLTKIFHPNVDKLGRICLDVLKSRFLRGAVPPLFSR